MIHELIVTSAPRGLQAGRSGFTTVLQTRGIHPEIARRLEAASAYRHVFPQGDPRNPVIRSHIVVQGPAGTVSVLSRIVDAGNGYDGRSNKLAHHVALDATEIAARAQSSPAAALLALERADGYMKIWHGEPREEPVGPLVPPAPANPAPCGLWLRAAGDAGWAGFIADRALRREPTWIIAPAGVDLVELFAEALALVPGPQRWGVTFTSYALSAGDGLWLGTVEGSPEAEAARGQSRVAVVDLVRRPPLGSQSPLVAAARGTATVPWKRDGSGVPLASAGATTDFPWLQAANGTRPPPVSGRPPALGAGGWQTMPVGDAAVLAADAEAAALRRSRWIKAAIVFGTLAIVTVIGATGWVIFGKVIKNWCRSVTESEPKSSQISPGPGDAPPVTNEAPTPPNRQAAGTPAPPPGFADIAKAAAERAKKFADEVKTKGEAVQQYLTSADTFCQQLEGIAKEAENAVAAGKSPQPVVEPFENVKAQFERAVEQAIDITKEALSAAESAETASKQAADEVERARNEFNAAKSTLDSRRRAEPPGSPELPPLQDAYDAAMKVFQDAEKAEENASKLAKDAGECASRLGASGESLTNFQSRIDKAARQIEGSCGDYASAKGAFADLKDRLEKAGNMPREGLDSTDTDGRTKELCKIGDARVALRLPSELVTTGTGATWKLVCVSGSAADTWAFRAKPERPGDAVRLGSARVDNDRMLRVTLFPRTEQNADLRDALASAVLQLSDTFDPDANTYVQLCSPKRMPLLVFDRFLEGSGSGTNAKYTRLMPIKHALPKFGPWPVAASLHGTCGPLEGATIQERVELPRNLESQFAGRPAAVAMLWQWQDEPFLRIDLVMGNKAVQSDASSRASMQVVGATLQGRGLMLANAGCLGDHNPEAKEVFRGLPQLIVSSTTPFHISAMKPLVEDLFKQELCEQLDVDPGVKADEKVLALFSEQNDVSVKQWIKLLQHGLNDCSDYKQWVRHSYAAPDPEKPKNKPLTDVKEWEAQKKRHEDAASASPDYVVKYWDHVKSRFRLGKFDDPVAALLSRWHNELVNAEDLVRKVKAQPAKFNGDLFIEFPSIGGKCVLLTFEEGNSSEPAGEGTR